MKKLLKYLRNYRLESILGPLFKLLEASFELLVPLVMANIIDVGIKNQDSGYILRMGGVLVFLGITGLACSLTAQYFAARASVGFGTALRNDLFSHINRLSYAEIDTIGTATLITRMTSDINQVQSGVNLVLRLFLRSPFIVFGAMIMAFTVNAKAALVFAGAIPVLSLVVFGIMGISMPLYKKVQRQLDQVLLATRENLVGARVIRAFNRQEDEISKFDEANATLVRFQVFVGKISALMNPVTYVIINLAVILLIWVAGYQVDSGIITQGETVALVNYMSQILVELVKLANLIVTVSKSLACANRIGKIFEEKPSIVDKVPADWSEETPRGSRTGDAGLPNRSVVERADEKNQMGQKNWKGKPDSHKTCQAREAKVEFQNLEFYYKGAKEPSLSQISFRVFRGQTIGIIGGTGAGKSTLINLIPRFYDASKGSVLVDGIDVREYSLKELRRKIGIVPQKAVLFKGTLRENMLWGNPDADDGQIMNALNIAQAREFVDDKDQGLELSISQGGKNLSGGQRQRLTIARAIVKNPEILIMDDSASALDFATDARLRKAILQNTQKMTVFIVSQRASSIQFADQIIVLEDGHIAGLGTHDELIKTCQVYQEICYSQLSQKEVENNSGKAKGHVRINQGGDNGEEE